jgi:hypothetical protein
MWARFQPFGRTGSDCKRKQCDCGHGGTTTDLAFLRDSYLRKVINGIHIGHWGTFVKGLYVDTFGLGSDTGAFVGKDHTVKTPYKNERYLYLETGKVIPLCMGSTLWLRLLDCLYRQKQEWRQKSVVSLSSLQEIYVGLKSIEKCSAYTETEQKITVYLYHSPHMLPEVNEHLEQRVHEQQLRQLIREGVILCRGITLTDAMHVTR